MATLLREGQPIAASYEVEKFLGEGAFAEVYRVSHRFLGRQALKVFKAVGMTVEQTERMLGEAALLSRIGHPNIVRVFDANTTSTSKGMCGFFTMEYVAGGSLEQFWRSHGARFVPVETSVDLIAQVCQGLAIAHSEEPPIIHRDIKPQNILVGYDGGGLRAKLSDFGLAKRVDPMTLMASASGTLHFKPPEVFRDSKGDSRAGDVWALGTTLYLLLTDALPYPEMGQLETRTDSLGDPPDPPSRINIDADPELDAIVFKALAPDRSDRYESAQALLGDLNGWKSPPRPAGNPKATAWAESPSRKDVLGDRSTADEDEAREMASRALDLARQAGRLGEAADLMEEAFNKWPELRKRHEKRLLLWRNGVYG